MNNPESSNRSALSPGTHVIRIEYGGSVIEQRYHVAGAGPVCVAHSGGPGISWQYLRTPLLEQHLTMVYVEPVGTGASGRLPDPREYTLGTYTYFLHALISHLGRPGVALLGHSHGGFIAQEYALQHPEQVTSLILYDTSPVTGKDFWASAVAEMEDFAQRHVVEHPEVSDYVASLSTPLGDLDDEAATAVTRQIMPAYFFDYWGREAEFAAGRDSLRMYAAPNRGEGPPFDVREQLPAITAPTLVVVGTRDFICGTRWADMLHEGIPGAELVVLERSGHMGHLEEGEKFTSSVSDFLTRSSYGTSPTNSADAVER
ncbi:alpha/beta fold hydrolase [Streptomyces sp. NPDC060030]|uniref:alpha/beta fold hydrolase n=1 Tax=Streptomyces sp. NPDC060030 TaxID=3347042 RepID=UPI00367B3703